MERLNIRVSEFAHKESKYPTRSINLWTWLLGENEYAVTVKRLRKTNDNDERNSLKSILPAITPSGLFSKRCANCLIEPANLICIDIDGKDNPSISDMEELKIGLGKLPYIMYCGLSASGKGLFCIIPYDDCKKHKLYFYSLEQEFKSMGIVVDSSCSDICRLRFYSYDGHPYVNPDAEKYVCTLEKSNVIRSKFHQQTKIKDSSEPTRKETHKELSIEEALLQPTNLDLVSGITLSKTQKVERLLKLVIEKQIDITVSYSDWIAICYIIKNLLGDKGIELFHQVCSFYPNYDFEEVEKLYLSAVKDKYYYNTDRLFEIAAKYGVNE